MAQPWRVQQLRNWRFLPLAVSLVALIFIQPHVEGLRGAAAALLTVVVIAGAMGLRQHRRLFTAALVLLVPALVLRWLSQFVSGSVFLSALAIILIASFIFFLTGGVIMLVTNERQVSVDTIVGSTCGYMLIGIGFALIYSLILTLDPSALELGIHADRMVGPAKVMSLSTLTYFSFVTMTTTGYGDVLPRSPIAQGMTTLQAVIGQIYLAAFVAYLVGRFLERGGVVSRED